MMIQEYGLLAMSIAVVGVFFYLWAQVVDSDNENSITRWYNEGLFNWNKEFNYDYEIGDYVTASDKLHAVRNGLVLDGIAIKPSFSVTNDGQVRIIYPNIKATSGSTVTEVIYTDSNYEAYRTAANANATTVNGITYDRVEFVAKQDVEPYQWLESIAGITVEDADGNKQTIVSADKTNRKIVIDSTYVKDFAIVVDEYTTVSTKNDDYLMAGTLYDEYGNIIENSEAENLSEYVYTKKSYVARHVSYDSSSSTNPTTDESNNITIDNDASKKYVVAYRITTTNNQKAEYTAMFTNKVRSQSNVNLPIEDDNETGGTT